MGDKEFKELEEIEKAIEEEVSELEELVAGELKEEKEVDELANLIVEYEQELMELEKDMEELEEDEEGLVNLFEHEDIDSFVERSGSDVVVDNIVYDREGKPIEMFTGGGMSIGFISLDNILVPPRGRVLQDNLSDLEESIHLWGLIEPLHVIPHENGEDFYLVHGYRRYLACRNLGMEEIPVIINNSRPKEIVRYLEVISNNVKKYAFNEMMMIGEFIEERQHSFSHETIENILGLFTGEYLKAKYIYSAREEFSDIYLRVLQGKMTIDQAFKKIEKEIQKAEDALNNPVIEDDKDYDEVMDEEYVQDVKDRHPLDPALRKIVEGRDEHTCQCCGMGRDLEDLSIIFEVHHIVPVKQKGADKRGNLILLCPNCHDYVHAYELDKFKPSQEVVDKFAVMHNIVVLGNIIKKGLRDNNIEAYDFFKSMQRI